MRRDVRRCGKKSRDGRRWGLSRDGPSKVPIRTIKAIFKGRVTVLVWRYSGKLFWKKQQLRIPDQDSNLDLSVTSSLIYCKSDDLDHAATEAGYLVLNLGVYQTNRESEERFWNKINLNTPYRDSILNPTFIGCLVYCEGSALDHAATEQLVDDDGSVETALINYLFAKQVVNRLRSQMDVSDLQRKRSYWKQCAFNAVSCFGK
uniref:(California timema) hypothetical protein n=1 Tax=Timema californicum TaxID=61474 RepID=A0A7R9P2R8_TIMCA|nr:unnamed protein product [Timema californicum]